MERPIGLVYW